MSDKGEIIDFVITPGNVDDRQPLQETNFLKKISRKLFADKGCISKNLFENLFLDGIHLINGTRSNMKNQMMTMFDRIMLRKRSIIETINNELKNIFQVEHSIHRSFTNFLTKMISGLLAYSFLPKKPCIKYDKMPVRNQLTLF